MKQLSLLFTLFLLMTTFVVATENEPLTDTTIVITQDSTSKKKTEKKIASLGPVQVNSIFTRTSSLEFEDIDLGGDDTFNTFSPMFSLFEKGMTGLLIWGLLLYVSIIGGIIFLIVYFLRSNRKREKQRQELFTKYIEAGQPIPEHLKDNIPGKQQYLKSGLLWLAVGLGVLFLVKELAAIPIFVGIAYIILYFWKKNNSSNENPNG